MSRATSLYFQYSQPACRGGAACWARFQFFISPDIFNISKSHFGKYDSRHTSLSLLCLCLRWNGFFPHHLTRQQRGAFSAPCRVMISISNRLSVLFFCGSFRGHWMVAEWPWSWIHAPKWYSDHSLVGWCWYLVQRRFITYSFPPIYSPFHHCFCSERCYFCTFGGWLVACRAIMVAVGESYDLTLWQEIITLFTVQ